jgi:DNA repair photolyase
MKAIYTPAGKAGEYAKFACNLYLKCGHGCTYCYVPAMLRKTKEDFFNNPQPRNGIIEALEKEAPKYKGKEVFLCFTCDPYQPINQEFQLTRQAIEILHSNNVSVNILTKGVITDFDLLKERPSLSKVGVTLTDLCVGIGSGLEPHTASYDDRVDNLISAKECNIKNWVSLEPVINPELSLQFIRQLDGFVDAWKIGKWNYSPEAKKIDWHKFVNEAIEILEKNGNKYYVNEDLRKYI